MNPFNPFAEPIMKMATAPAPPEDFMNQVQNPDGSFNYESMFEKILNGYASLLGFWIDLSAKGHNGAMHEAMVIDKMDDRAAEAIPPTLLLLEFIDAKKENRPPDYGKVIRELLSM